MSVTGKLPQAFKNGCYWKSRKWSLFDLPGSCKCDERSSREIVFQHSPHINIDRRVKPVTSDKGKNDYYKSGNTSHKRTVWPLV